MNHMEHVKQLLYKEPDVFCVSWIQRRLRLGYANACTLRDEALNAGLVTRVYRVKADEVKEFAYVQPGRKPGAEQVWIPEG